MMVFFISTIIQLTTKFVVQTRDAETPTDNSADFESFMSHNLWPFNLGKRASVTKGSQVAPGSPYTQDQIKLNNKVIFYHRTLYEVWPSFTTL